jgi:TatD DNase family protein
MMRLVDIGANLTHRSFRDDRAAVIARARAAGIGDIVVTGTSVAASRAAWELTISDARLRSTAGVHPHEARRWGDDAHEAIGELVQRPEVVAVGECGLDYDRDVSPRPAQRRAFEAQLALAASVGKPAFLHERAAQPDFIAILREHRPHLSRAVVHCFTGDEATLDRYLSLDLHIGVTGWICDPRRGQDLRRAIARVPAGRLMLETDAPFLTPRGVAPPPARGRNEPALLVHVLDAVAAARGEAAEVVAAHTTSTATTFFGLSP